MSLFIFISSRTRTAWPRVTLSPTAQLISMMVPGIGATTSVPSTGAWGSAGAARRGRGGGSRGCGRGGSSGRGGYRGSSGRSGAGGNLFNGDIVYFTIDGGC